MLAEYVEAARSTPFEWGTHDCALWAARWVRLCTGNDYVSDWEGYYRTERGAKIRMTRKGFSGVAAIASAHLPEKPVPLARRGDLVLHPITESLGVCSGMRSHFAGESGLVTIDTLACVRAWGVD
jgi:hypothetical protein